MLAFDSELTFPSELPGCEGVSFQIRRLTRLQRARRDAAIVAHRVQLSRLQAQRDALPPDPLYRVFEIQGAAVDAKRELTAEEQVEIETVKESAAAKLGDPAVIQTRIDRTRLTHEIELIIDQYIAPESLRAGLISIEGLVVNGTPVTTADQLMASGPDDLTEEILGRISETSGLSSEQLKNWQWPLISPGAAAKSPANSAVPASEAALASAQ